jgi:hypothetical protein
MTSHAAASQAVRAGILILKQPFSNMPVQIIPSNAAGK